MEGRPFVLLGVDSVDDRETLKETLREKDLSWRNFADEDHHLASAWGVEYYPTLFLIDQNGIVRNRFDGKPEAQELDRAIDRLVEVAEKDGSRAATAR